MRIKIEVDVGERLQESSRWMARRPWLLGLIVLVAGGATAMAIEDPGDFQNGTTIDADIVNARFKRLYQSVGLLEARAAQGGVPVGTIIASMLTPEQMTASEPDDETWVIADGSKYPTSAWGTLTSNASVPDLRGVFLRGQNLGRATNFGNPDGIALGEYQGDSFASHSHTVFNGSTADDGCGFGALLFSAGIYASGGGTCSGEFLGNSGGNETRPRNVTVNYFIRVD